MQRADQTDPVADHSAACSVGVARLDITPPLGIYSRMWGAALHDCATAIHRPLLATGLAISPDGGDSDSVQLVLALDLCVLGMAEMEEVVGAVMAATGLERREQLVITMSHTHAAPGILSREPSLTSLPGGHLIAGYFDAVKAGCVEVAVQAVSARRPAWLAFGQGQCDLAQNRDTWDGKNAATAPPGAGTAVRDTAAARASAASVGQWVCGYGTQDGRKADDTLVVAKITARAAARAGSVLAEPTGDETAEVLATLMNYGCHPTTLGPGNKHLSPDYIGAARDIVEDRFGGICVFVLGACGDTAPKISYAADPAAADRNGRILGFAAASALECLLPGGTSLRYTGAIVSGATLAGWAGAPLDPAGDGPLGLVRSALLPVQMPLLPQLSLDECEANFTAAEGVLKAAAASHGEDSVAFRDARAISERWRRAANRARTRAAAGPDANSTTECPVTVAQFGPNAFFVGVPGEPYSSLQVQLRERFPGATVIVAALCNNAGEITYMLPSDKAGQGTYQDELMTMLPGSLEQLEDDVAAQLVKWGAVDSGAAADRPAALSMLVEAEVEAARL